MAKKKVIRKRRPSPAAASGNAESPAFEKPAVKKKVKKKVATTEPSPAKKKKKTKKQLREEAWGDKDRIHAQVASSLTSLVRQATKEFGDPDVCTAGEAGRFSIGLKLPSFAAEYLFDSNVLTLGRIMQIVGTEGTFKTGLATEIGRWYIKYSGAVGWFEHESRYSPIWVLSTIGWENEDLFYHMPCDSIDEWQARLQHFIEAQKRVMKGTAAEPGPGMVYPVLGVVDSITAKAMLETQQKIDREGSAGRGHPVEAQSITRFMRHIPQKLRQWPMSLILVNHLKPQKDAQRPNVVHRNKAGGRGKDFQETWELEMITLGRTKVEKDMDSQQLIIKNAKNSLGNTHRQINLWVRWWNEPDDPDDPDSEWRQKTVWDWHGATTELLLHIKTSNDRAAERGKIKAIFGKEFHIEKVSGASKVWSRTLGISQKSPLSYADASLALYDNERVLKDLRNAFGIKVAKEFESGVDYRKQVGDEKRQVGKRVFKYK